VARHGTQAPGACQRTSALSSTSRSAGGTSALSGDSGHARGRAAGAGMRVAGSRTVPAASDQALGSVVACLPRSSRTSTPSARTPTSIHLPCQ